MPRKPGGGVGQSIADFDFTKLTGISRRDDIYSMQPNKLWEARNAWPKNGPGGILGRRPGTRYLQNITGTGVNLNLFTSHDAVDGRRLYSVSKMVTANAGGFDHELRVFRPISGLRSMAGFNFITAPDVQYGRGFMMEFNGKTFWLPGRHSGQKLLDNGQISSGYQVPDNAAFIWMQDNWIGLPWQQSVDALGNFTSDTSKWGDLAKSIAPTWATIYKDQMVLAGMDGEYSNSIIFCDVDDFLMPTLTDTQFAEQQPFQIGPVQGDDKVVAVLQQSLYGGASVINSPLLIWKERSLWAGIGTPPAAGILHTMQFSKLNAKAGTQSPHTIVETPFGVIWASQDNVWLWDGGPAPKPIGLDIGPILRASAAGINNWHAAYWGDSGSGIYVLSLTLPDDTLDNLGYTNQVTNSWPNKQCTVQIWLDMRRGLNADSPQWWGPMEIPSASLHYVREGWEGGPQLIGAYDIPNESGTLFSRLIAYDVESERGWDDHVIAARDLSIDNVTAQPTRMKLVTGYSPLGDGQVKKIIDTIEISYGNEQSVEARARFTVKTVVDGGRFISTETVVAPVASDDAFNEDYGGIMGTGTGNAEGPNTTVADIDTVVYHTNRAGVHPKMYRGDMMASRMAGYYVGFEIEQQIDAREPTDDVYEDSWAKFNETVTLPDAGTVSVTPGEPQITAVNPALGAPTAKALEIHGATIRYIRIPRRPS